MDIIKQNELTVEWNIIKTINYRMYLVFIFLMSQNLSFYIVTKKYLILILIQKNTSIIYITHVIRLIFKAYQKD